MIGLELVPSSKTELAVLTFCVGFLMVFFVDVSSFVVFLTRRTGFDFRFLVGPEPNTGSLSLFDVPDPSFSSIIAGGTTLNESEASGGVI
jgi:hypothetical protein